MASVNGCFGTKVGIVTLEKQTQFNSAFSWRRHFVKRKAMALIARLLVVFLFIIGGCFPIVIRKKRMKCQRKGKSCSCTDSQTSSQESIDSIDSMSVVEPTTWQMPPKGRKRTRTISGASNFSGTSTMSTLSEKDRMWLQAFRYAGRWESWLDRFPMETRHCLHRALCETKGNICDSETIYRTTLTSLANTTQESDLTVIFQEFLKRTLHRKL